ncbi:MAG: TolC family protein [Methylococcales bacterium]|nr:TolC family protein [Methylococcales bacterium]
MSNFRHIIRSLFLILLASPICYAHEHAIVDHHHYFQIDKTLTLSKVIKLTLEKFPDQMLSSALKQEADALQQRGHSLLAGAPTFAMRYQDDLPGDDIGSREIEAELELPLWNWGQRSAGQAVAEQAHLVAKGQSSVILLNVAGLVRSALWNIELETLRHEQAILNLGISEKLLNKVKRRLELGDLPRSDLLLAQSDHLEKRALLAKAEAELMHARKGYISLTQITILPSSFKEELSSIKEITENHPKLFAINAVVNRKQAELNWVKSAGSGQNSFILGGKSEKGDENDDDIESMSVEVSIPFGGSAHLAPEIASANIELTEALAQRSHLFRDLEKEHHEAEHALEVTRTELKIANELKQIAEHHLKMTDLSFAAGEINLMDLLKIQARTHNATLLANEHEIMLQKNIALYNQAVGVLP